MTNATPSAGNDPVSPAANLRAMHLDIAYRATCLTGLCEGAELLFAEIPVSAPDPAANALMPLLRILIQESRALADLLEEMELALKQI